MLDMNTAPCRTDFTLNIGFLREKTAIDLYSSFAQFVYGKVTELVTQVRKVEKKMTD